jgi:hypothetical protein
LSRVTTGRRHDTGGPVGGSWRLYRGERRWATLDVMIQRSVTGHLVARLRCLGRRCMDSGDRIARVADSSDSRSIFRLVALGPGLCRRRRCSDGWMRLLRQRGCTNRCVAVKWLFCQRVCCRSARWLLSGDRADTLMLVVKRPVLFHGEGHRRRMGCVCGWWMRLAKEIGARGRSRFEARLPRFSLTQFVSSLHSLP